MPCLQLHGGACSASLSTRGGALWSFDFLHHGRRVPLLFPRGQRGDDEAALSACFPLVPFGNRLRDNGFSFEGRHYSFSPNVPGDPLYLHGDGWLQEWQVERCEVDRVSLLLDRGREESGPYCYQARQEIAIRDNALHLGLFITNHGDEAMPYGFGWHPFFPLTQDTRLQASASRYWLEGAQHLPTLRAPMPPDLDFNQSRSLPVRWINNCFEGWNGKAEILWPDQDLALTISASGTCQHYVIYRPNPEAPPDGAEEDARDFFCFEPMSHAIDAHHRQDQGGLVRLAPGETQAGHLTFTPRALKA